MEANLQKEPTSLSNEDRPTCITASEKRVARHLFIIEGWSTNKIAHALGRHEQAVYRLYSRYKWRKLKDRLEKKLIEKALKSSETEFKQIIGLSTEVIKRFLVQSLRDDTPVTFKDAKLTSDMAANYWRLYQVVQGKPSDIKEVVKMTDDEAKSMMRQMFEDLRDDPMLDVEHLYGSKSEEDGKVH